VGLAGLLASHPAGRAAEPPPPNIVLLLSDDQGWGDVGYNGNRTVKTPVLDSMAARGVRFDRYYAAGPVCSPTRASCLTGRHPYRYGIRWANDGYLPRSEVTIAEALKHAGYRTGHFGKWHVGSLSRTVVDGYKGGPQNAAEYSPPWENGFDVCFTQEIGGPTYNPTVWAQGKPGSPEYRFIMQRAVKPDETLGMPGVYAWPSAFWTGPGRIETENVGGDSSRVIMDRAIRFIETEAAAGKPFLAVIWFNTPHSPIAAGDEHRRPYAQLPIEAQHWFGCLTAMDEQIGRLRERLRALGVADRTILWFSSDNGPSWIHSYYSAGPLRDKMGTLYEGGIRVPAVLEWPARLRQPRVIAAPCVTSDIYPTLLAAARHRVRPQPEPLDGIDLLPLLEGRTAERRRPIAFQSPERIGPGDQVDMDRRHLALTGDRYKILSRDNGATYSLYDLIEDPGESRDLAAEKPAVLAGMRSELERWVRSCARSAAGADYRPR
jgi:arylsulfatase A-like enzyme